MRQPLRCCSSFIILCSQVSVSFSPGLYIEVRKLHVLFCLRSRKDFSSSVHVPPFATLLNPVMYLSYVLNKRFQQLLAAQVRWNLAHREQNGSGEGPVLMGWGVDRKHSLPGKP